MADFGFSSRLDKYGTGKLKTSLGSEGYMAPEIYLKIDYNGTSVDLFSTAVILFILKSGAPPFF